MKYVNPEYVSFVVESKDVITTSIDITTTQMGDVKVVTTTEYVKGTSEVVNKSAEFFVELNSLGI